MSFAQSHLGGLVVPSLMTTHTHTHTLKGIEIAELFGYVSPMCRAVCWLTRQDYIKQTGLFYGGLASFALSHSHTHTHADTHTHTHTLSCR